MVQITSERQNKQEEDPAYRRAQKEIGRKLELRVKERNTEEPAKPKQLEQGQGLAFSLCYNNHAGRIICRHVLASSTFKARH